MKELLEFTRLTWLETLIGVVGIIVFIGTFTALLTLIWHVVQP